MSKSIQFTTPPPPTICFKQLYREGCVICSTEKRLISLWNKAQRGRKKEWKWWRCFWHSLALKKQQQQSHLLIFSLAKQLRAFVSLLTYTEAKQLRQFLPVTRIFSSKIITVVLANNSLEGFETKERWKQTNKQTNNNEKQKQSKTKQNNKNPIIYPCIFYKQTNKTKQPNDF